MGKYTFLKHRVDDPAFKEPPPMTEGKLGAILHIAETITDSATTSVYGKRNESAVWNTFPFAPKILPEFPRSEMGAALRAEQVRIAAILHRREERTWLWIKHNRELRVVWDNAAYQKDYLLPLEHTKGFENEPRHCKCLLGRCDSRTPRCMSNPNVKFEGHNED